MGAAARMRAAALTVGAARIARMPQPLLNWPETCAGGDDDDKNGNDDVDGNDDGHNYND